MNDKVRFGVFVDFRNPAGAGQSDQKRYSETLQNVRAGSSVARHSYRDNHDGVADRVSRHWGA